MLKKMCQTREMGERWLVGVPPTNNFFFVFFQIFSDLHFAESLPSARHSAKSLPSARQKELGKEAFADSFFSERSLPSATLGKAFAECK